MKLMMPFKIHLANECLKKLGTTNSSQWPEIKKNVLNFTEIDLVIQVNGKSEFNKVQKKYTRKRCYQKSFI